MSKKNFKQGFGGILGEKETGGPSIKSTISSLTTKKGLSKRATFIVYTEHLDALKAIAFWERKLLKDILYDALSSHIKKYEKINGEIKYPEAE